MRLRTALAVLTAALVVLGCATGAAATYPRYHTAPPEAGHGPPRLDEPPPATADTIVFLGVEYPEPGTIGAHYAGVQFEVRVASISLTEGIRRSLSLASALRLAAAMGRAGYQVRQGGLPSSDPPPLEGARFALIGRIVELAVRSSGTTGPHRVRAETQIAWELLDLSAGRPAFGVRTSGRAQARDSVAESVLHAVDGALVGLLQHAGFRAVLARLEPGSPGLASTDHLFLGISAGAGDAVALSPEQLNLRESGDPLILLAGGVVALGGADRFDEPAFVITGDGLVLTSSRAVQNRARLWVRFGNGVERPAGLLRADRSTGVALIRISCPSSCTTVPWTLEIGAAREPIVAVRPPSGSDPSHLFVPGEVRVTGEPSVRRLEVRFEARVAIGLRGGEPIARKRDGAVFAIAAPWRGTIRGVPLADALRGLSVVAQRDQALGSRE
jgi:hypothetical protein